MPGPTLDATLLGVMHTPSFPRLSSSCALIGLLILAACSAPPAATPPAASTAPAVSPAVSPMPEGPALECEEHGYPCSMADVPTEVVERSMELGDEASDRMADGEAFDEVAEWLRAEPGMAEVAVDGEALRYRLTDGRPAWLATAPDEPAQAESGAIDATLAIHYTVAGNDDPTKRATILSPYRYRLGEEDAGARVADLMRATRGYASGVTYAANATQADSEVTVDDFAELAGNAVVYLQTGSTRICNDETTPFDELVTTPLDGPCWGVILAQPFSGTAESFRQQGHVGVDLVKYADPAWGWSLGLNGDFFSAHYGHGIDGAIIVLNVGADLGPTGLPGRIAGMTSDVLFWNAKRPAGPGGEVTLSLLQRLVESGRTVQTVVAEMGDALRAGDAQLVALPPEAGGSNRIREIVQLRDRSSGEPLDEVGVVNVATKLGDGEHDQVPYMVDIEGLSPEEAAETNVNLFLGNWDMDPLLAGDGEQIGDTTWRLQGLAEIGDLDEGQSLEILAYVQLPEGGLSRDPADVRVAGVKRPEIGRAWAGTITSVLPIGDGTRETRTAEVEFTQEPNADPEADWVYFYVTGGSLTWDMSGSDSACSYSGFAAGLPLDATEFNYLVLDVSGESVKYWAQANNDDGPEAEVSASCNDGRSFTYGTGADGVWWSIPSDAPHTLEGDVMSGTREDPTTGITWTWELHRVDD